MFRTILMAGILSAGTLALTACDNEGYDRQNPRRDTGRTNVDRAPSGDTVNRTAPDTGAGAAGDRSMGAGSATRPSTRPTTMPMPQ